MKFYSAAKWLSLNLEVCYWPETVNILFIKNALNSDHLICASSKKFFFTTHAHSRLEFPSFANGYDTKNFERKVIE